MRLMAVVVAAFAVATVSAADAAPPKKRVVQRETIAYPGPGSTYIMSRDEQGRTRTKILVQKRSYLDGGTEVMPGGIQTNRENMINSMYYSPSRASVSNDNVWQSRPVNDPFFLPGKDNPYFR